MIDPLALRSRIMLQMARPGADAEQETKAAIEYLEKLQHPYANWLIPPEVPITLDDLEFTPLGEVAARIFHEHFHYIGSYRSGKHYCLRDKETQRIVCMGSIAHCDLEHVKDKIGTCSAVVLSRFFAFRWAPKYCFSFFIGKLRQHLIGLDVDLMFSFINPNLGFDGRSHKGAQFYDFATEKGTRYMYLDGQYQTMRFFVKKYGTSEPEALKAIIGDGFQISEELLPLMILANPLQKRGRSVIPATPYLFRRPVI